MKILIAYPNFPHYRLPVLKALSRDKDIEYILLTGPVSDVSIKTLDPAQISFLQWKSVKNIWLGKSDFLWQTGLIRECLFGKYDGVIFLASPYFISTWVSAILLRLTKTKVIFWAHAIVRNKLRDKIKLFFFKLAHGMLLYGNGARQNLINYGFDANNIFVIYNSLDYDVQHKIQQTLNLEQLPRLRNDTFPNPTLPILLFIGRLTVVKKLDDLIYAAAELHKQKMPVNVLFIGDGTERQHLQALAKKLSLEDYVFFYGECYDEETLSKLIAMSDVCVSPGNVGLTAMHALTYGTPVITHNNAFMQMPEYEAIEPGITGMLYEYGSLDSLVKNIYSWLNKHKQSREEIRTRCFQIIDQYYNPEFQASAIKAAILHVTGQQTQDKHLHA